MSTITITAGRPSRQGDETEFDGPDGTYPVTLIAVTDEIIEKSTMPSKRKDDDGTWAYRDWTFAIDDGSDLEGQVIDLRANARSTGPKSQQYAIIAALTAKTPPVGATVDIEKHLIGRGALARIVRMRSGEVDPDGYPKVVTLMARPVERPAKGNGKAPAPAPEPAPAPAAVDDGDLPF